MKDKEIDFYGYGKKAANSVYDNIKKIRQDILKNYGKDALLQFDCGFIISNASFNLEQMEQSIPEINDIISGKLDTLENVRNNSYFDKKGTSNKYGVHGNYSDPMKGK